MKIKSDNVLREHTNRNIGQFSRLSHIPIDGLSSNILYVSLYIYRITNTFEWTWQKSRGGAERFLSCPRKRVSYPFQYALMKRIANPNIFIKICLLYYNILQIVTDSDRYKYMYGLIWYTVGSSKDVVIVATSRFYTIIIYINVCSLWHFAAFTLGIIY